MNKPLSPAAHLLGERLRRARFDAGLNQKDVAALAHLHVTSYGKIERGLANPSLLTMLRIACVLGQDMATLTRGMTGAHLPGGYGILTVPRPAAETGTLAATAASIQ